MDIEGHKVAAVERALSIIDAFDVQSPRLTLAELHKKTGIAKATLLRLIHSLLDRGLIAISENGSYSIGAAAVRLANLHNVAGGEENAIIKWLDLLATETGETASYSIVQGELRIYLFRVNSRYRLRDHVQPGDSAPLGVGATGRALLEFRSGAPTSKRSRKLHFVSSGEREPGMVGLSSPVFSHDGKLAGAVSISGPGSRITQARIPSFARQVITAAMKVSVALGGASEVYKAALGDLKAG